MTEKHLVGQATTMLRAGFMIVHFLSRIHLNDVAIDCDDEQCNLSTFLAFHQIAMNLAVGNFR